MVYWKAFSLHLRVAGYLDVSSHTSLGHVEATSSSSSCYNGLHRRGQMSCSRDTRPPYATRDTRASCQLLKANYGSNLLACQRSQPSLRFGVASVVAACVQPGPDYNIWKILLSTFCSRVSTVAAAVGHLGKIGSKTTLVAVFVRSTLKFGLRFSSFFF